MTFKEKKKKKIERKGLKTVHKVKVERKVNSQRSKQGFNECLKTIQFMAEYSMFKDQFLHRKLFPHLIKVKLNNLLLTKYIYFSSLLP